MIISIDGSSARRVLLAIKVGREMFSGEEGTVEVEDIAFNIFLLKSPVPTIISDCINSVASPPIKRRSVKKSSVGIPFREPVNPGFKSLELLLLLKDDTEIPSKLLFQLVEERPKGYSWGISIFHLV